MKKLLGHLGKRTKNHEYEEQWDDMEDLEYEDFEDGEYYEEDEYYARDEADSEEYYADEEADSEEYYADEESDGEEYYADEEYGEEEYYADEEADGDEYYAEEDGDEAYYADDVEYEDSYFEDDEELEYMQEEQYDDWAAPVYGNFFERMLSKFRNMDTVDRVMACTGVAVLVLALITGTVFAGTRLTTKQVNSFSTVGNQLDGISVIGGEGLTAVADAQIARQEAADLLEQEQQEAEAGYEEEEYSNDVTVALNMTSIKKDLKIKIVNKKTGKLIPNVPFEVTVTGPKGKAETWTDDDKDGIIYKTDIASGEYKVALNELAGEAFAKFRISTTAQNMKVKENLDYEKVDVSDEIKDESQIDASKEDTAKNDVEEESKLQDTVTWVESTKTPINETYVEVNKNTIEDPQTKVSSLGSFMKLSGTTVETRDASVSIEGGGSIASEGSASLKANVSGVNGAAYTWSASAPEGVTASFSDTLAQETTLNVKNTTTSKQTVTVTVKVTGTQSTVSGSESAESPYEGSATATITVEAAAVTANPVTLSQTTLNLNVGGSAALTATQKDNTAFTWNSSDKAIATVDEKGTVKAVKAGTATITVTGADGQTATCTVTVTNTAVTLKLDKTNETLLAGKTLEIKPTITGNATSNNKITWTSSDANIAKVSGDNAKATVTGVKKGTATITASYTENGTTVTATCTINVKNSAELDTTTALKDKSGNQLYVKNAQGQYVAATYADYYKANQKFYLKQQGYKYTGWQTLDGKVYFFDGNGNKITGAHVIQGAQYNFDSNGVLVSSNGALGIDVSKWNGSIDWNAVKNSGVSYVIIRCGYRGSSQGSLIEDPKYRTNIQGATKAGLKVGVYFFTQAVNEIEAVEEASMVLSLVKGYKISYPIFLDVESSGGRADGISKETRTAVCKAFCQTIQNSGYTAGVYANKTWFNNYIDAGQLGAYRIWLAQYASKPTYGGRYDIWQYSSKGKVSGISGNVDMNLSYMGY